MNTDFIKVAYTQGLIAGQYDTKYQPGQYFNSKTRRTANPKTVKSNNTIYGNSYRSFNESYKYTTQKNLYNKCYGMGYNDAFSKFDYNINTIPDFETMAQYDYVDDYQYNSDYEEE